MAQLSQVTRSTYTEHYDPRWAAEGGPVPNGPTMFTHVYEENEPCGIAIMPINCERWGVVNIHTKQIYASSMDPADLAVWMQTYLVRLHDEVMGEV